jgi:hypothetical protein
LPCFFFLAHRQKKKRYDLKHFPEGKTPGETGTWIAERFLKTTLSIYGSTHPDTPPTQIIHPDVCTWLGGVWFAKVTRNDALYSCFESRFTSLFDKEANLLPRPNHVDNNVSGSVSLELYMKTKQKKFLEIGLKYTDSHWIIPENANPEGKTWVDHGYSWQTRIWIDNIFMITAVNTQEYRATGDRKYIDRAAKEMIIYIDEIQFENRLFSTPRKHISWTLKDIQIIPVTFPLPEKAKKINGQRDEHSIRYPRKYTRKNRQVVLTGEAYFDVVSDHLHPFFVKTVDIDIKVMATKFNVAAYNEDDFLSDVLEEGQLQVQNPQLKLMKDIFPGEKFRFPENTRKAVVSKVETVKYISWKDGRLVFRNDPLSAVCTKLRRWYNAEIVLDDNTGNLLTHPFTITIETETLPHVLDYLCQAAPIEYKVVYVPKDGEPKFVRPKYIIRSRKKNKPDANLKIMPMR